MTMQRLRQWLGGALVVLVLANVVVWLRTPAVTPPSSATHGPAGGLPDAASHTEAAPPWARWRGMTTAQRAAYVVAYEALTRRPDGNAVLRRANAFRKVPYAEQARLREIHALIGRTLARRPPDQRHDLLRADPAARAYLLYRILVAEEPGELSRIRALRGSQVPATAPAALPG